MATASPGSKFRLLRPESDSICLNDVGILIAKCPTSMVPAKIAAFAKEKMTKNTKIRKNGTDISGIMEENPPKLARILAILLIKAADT